jgi:hypothetical protein
MNYYKPKEWIIKLVFYVHKILLSKLPLTGYYTHEKRVYKCL